MTSILNNWNTLTSRQATCLFATPNTKQSFSIDLVNIPKIPINTITETPNLPQKDINNKESARTIIGSEPFPDSIFEKLTIENLKAEIISSLESTNYFLFQKELNTLKEKCEKLIQHS